MYKQIIFLLGTLFLIQIYAQIPVFEDNKFIGILDNETNYNCISCYYKDNFLLFNKRIYVNIPVIVEGRNDKDGNYLSGQYYKEIVILNKNKIIVKFNNYSNGGSNWLYISKFKNKLYIMKSLSFSNGIKKIEIDKDDYDYKPSTLVCTKNFKMEINKELSFLDFFDFTENQKDCYHCPRDISVEDCLKSEKKIFTWE